jgi:hypothetical protein
MSDVGAPKGICDSGTLQQELRGDKAEGGDMCRPSFSQKDGARNDGASDVRHRGRSDLGPKAGFDGGDS